MHVHIIQYFDIVSNKYPRTNVVVLDATISLMNQYCNRRWKDKSPHLGIIMLLSSKQKFFPCCQYYFNLHFFFSEEWEGPAPLTSTNLIIHMSLNKPWRRVRLVDALLRFCFLELHWLDTTCKRRYHGCGVHVCHNTTVNTPRTKPPEQQRSRRGPPPLPQTGSDVPLLCSSRARLAPNGYWGLFRFVGLFFFL